MLCPRVSNHFSIFNERAIYHKNSKSLERAKNKSNKLSYFHFMFIAHAKTTPRHNKGLNSTHIFSDSYFIWHTTIIPTGGHKPNHNRICFFLNSGLINQIRLHRAVEDDWVLRKKHSLHHQ